MGIVREAIAAGRFYPESKAALVRTIEDCFLGEHGPGKLPAGSEKHGNQTVIGLVCPHAGYIYSGPAAAHAFAELEGEPIPKSVVILGPNHSGMGARISVYPEGRWRTPLGDVVVDQSTAEAIVDSSDCISADFAAHRVEHSIEVQLPFLQYLYGDNFEIVPICLGDQTLQTCSEVGRAIYAATNGRMPLIIASSDFSHYESAASAREKDHKALGQILQVNAQGLLEIVDMLQISMCGPGAVATMLIGAKKYGQVKAEVLTYQNSGNVTGELDSVVGYAAVAVRI